MDKEQAENKKPRPERTPAEEPSADASTAKLLGKLTSELNSVKKGAEAEKARADDMTATAQRLQADFDNYRKRNTEAIARARKDGQCEVIEGIFPALDVFESALAMIKDKAVAQGVRMVQRKFQDVLADYGVTQIPALGEDFDPAFHDAIEHVEVEDEKDSGKIVAVLQQGYRMGDKILRHSLVKVGK